MKTTHIAVALLIGAFALIVTAHDASAQKRPGAVIVVAPPPPPPTPPIISPL